MASSKNIISESILLEEHQAQEIAQLEKQTMDDKQQALLNFQKKELEINREKEASEEVSLAQYHADLKRVETTFKHAPQAGWVQYQAADTEQKEGQKKALLRHSNRGIEINAVYEQQTEKNTTHYHNEVIEIERQLKSANLSIVQKYQRIRKERIENAARVPYQRATDEAWSVYEESTHQAKTHFRDASKAAHVLSVEETNAEVEKFHQARLAVREESYLMIAQKMGLDGIADDIWEYVSQDDTYASVQPLLGYTDLRLALAQAAKRAEQSTLIDTFYQVNTADKNVNVSELEAKVQSLDLAATAQLFKHECVFMAAPSSPEKNKLYVDLKGGNLTCALLTPYGAVIRKSYTEDSRVAGESLEAAFKHGRMLEYIQKRSLYFVMDLNYGTPASTCDAFLSLIHSQTGFKAHVMNTIATYNRELARSHGFNTLKLCKKHLSCSSDQGSTILEETPWYQLVEPHNQVTSEISKRYYAECETLKTACKQTILDAKKLRNDAIHAAEIIYNAACGKSTAATDKQQMITDESLVSPTNVTTQLISPLPPKVEAQATHRAQAKVNGVGFFKEGKYQKKPLKLELGNIDEFDKVAPMRVEEKVEMGKTSGSHEFNEQDPDITSLLEGMGLI